MYDRFTHICFTSDNGEAFTDSGIFETDNDFSSASESPTDIDNTGDTVSDAVGDNSVTDSVTENSAEASSPSSPDNTSDGMEIEGVFFTDYSQSETVNYTPELEYIDYLLSTQIQNQLAVQSVSGNSIVMSIDENGSQLLCEIKENQIVTQEKCDLMINLTGCLLFAVLAEYLIMSSKRIVKKMINRKE